MKFSAAILALTASLTCALPSPQAPVFPLPPADTTYYYFRSSVLSNQGNKTKYNDLYMVAYHTGAGLSAATFQPAPLNSHRGWFNGTQLRWFEPTPANSVTFGVAWGSGTSYDLWYPTEINGGYGTGDFKLDDNNNLITTDKYVGGWIVCDWSHGVPQLFNLVSYAANVTIPDTCARVNLVAEVAPPLATATTSGSISSATSSASGSS
ncbi:hypothetical protein BLS_007250 [Venturia inaequalis]|uniref:DUF7907 domain-containing protein n=1 Tax=Venturia inaequalis TaxID=5025 RepID=A0A8H3UC86_VENIN|nr:hypothetical protein EG328_008590 [Venturia inaequalis]KAE9981558.1 hypothetical protein BLS_007250 [Venturia inaequalis]KAE9991810.1 hypothetical protein EG327_010911 [Venturia inaequalis]